MLIQQEMQHGGMQEQREQGQQHEPQQQEHQLLGAPGGALTPPDVAGTTAAAAAPPATATGAASMRDLAYGPFLKMLQMGVPRQAVENKLVAAGLDPALLDDHHSPTESGSNTTSASSSSSTSDTKNSTTSTTMNSTTSTTSTTSMSSPPAGEKPNPGLLAGIAGFDKSSLLKKPKASETGAAVPNSRNAFVASIAEFNPRRLKSTDSKSATSKNPGTSSTNSRGAAGGSSLVSSIAGFDRSKLRRRDLPAEHKPAPQSSNPLFAALNSALSKRREEIEPESGDEDSDWSSAKN
jgi:hypothetical protein